MHPESLFRNVTLGMDVMMEDLAGRDAVEQLDAADLDQPMPLIGVKPGRFGIEHNLAHYSWSENHFRRLGILATLAQDFRHLRARGLETL